MARQHVCKSPASTISAGALKWEKIDCHSHLISLAELLLSERGTSQRQVAWETMMLCRVLGNQQRIICMFMALDARRNNSTGLIFIWLIC